MHACIHTHTHTHACMHAYVRTYIHTYIHTHTHTHTHTCRQEVQKPIAARWVHCHIRVQGLGTTHMGLGFRLHTYGFRVQGLGFRVQGLGCRVQGLGYAHMRLGFKYHTYLQEVQKPIAARWVHCHIWVHCQHVRLAFQYSVVVPEVCMLICRLHYVFYTMYYIYHIQITLCIIYEHINHAAGLLVQCSRP